MTLDLPAFLAMTLANATPLLLAATGGIYSERSGIVNIALEGMMLAGAFAAVCGARWTGSPWGGLLAAMAAGGALGAIHAFACIRAKADQIVSGTALNILSLGATGFLLFHVFGVHGSSPSAPKLHALRFGPGFRLSPLTLLSFGAVILSWTVLYRTRFGLRIRAAGERPETVRALGVNISRIRTEAVILSGLLAGMGGAYLSLCDLSQFVERMTAGRGFIALAALIFGKWKPFGVLAACLLFGSIEAFADSLQGYAVRVPAQVLLVLPFVLTMIVLAGFVGRSRPPEALGKRQ